MKDPFLVLKNIFGLEKFREGQKEAIDKILNREDTICILPTGGGKSLVYQFPSVYLDSGITIVISPLIALMKDQVDSLNQLGVKASFLNSTQDELEQLKTISDAVNEKIKILILSPEKAVSNFFLFHLKKMNVNYFAIDEAHSVSQWGHDFRPEYRELHTLREVKPKSTYIVLTATATEKVIKDIKKVLDLKNPHLVKKSFYRKNLFFGIEYFESASEKEKRILKILETEILNLENSKAIIYCSTRQQTETLQKFLKENGISSIIYHAGKSDSIRTKNQDSYSKNKNQIMIATNAFGMGIDIPNVRLIVHYQTPASMESYYQEAGRAGRDGKNSKCILFFQKKDLTIQNFILSKESNRKQGETLLLEMKNYIFGQVCRQQKICSYFGEQIEPCGNCDICLDKKPNLYLEKLEDEKKIKLEKQIYEFSEDEIFVIQSLLKKLPGIFGKTMITSVLKGAKLKKILRLKLNEKEEFGKLKHIPEEAILHLFETWLGKKILMEAGTKFPKIYLKEFPPTTRKEKHNEEIELGIRKVKFVSPEQNLVKALKNFRDREARKLKWKKFMVLHNSTILRIAKLKPKNLNDLINVKGLGDAKISKFGNGILEVLEKYD